MLHPATPFSTPRTAPAPALVKVNFSSSLGSPDMYPLTKMVIQILTLTSQSFTNYGTCKMEIQQENCQNHAVEHNITSVDGWHLQLWLALDSLSHTLILLLLNGFSSECSSHACTWRLLQFQTIVTAEGNDPWLSLLSWGSSFRQHGNYTSCWTSRSTTLGFGITLGCITWPTF